LRPEPLKNHTFTGLRGRVTQFVESSRFIQFITVLIIINAVTMGLETDAGIRARHGEVLSVIDSVILYIFVAEIVLKLYAYRLTFFRAGWNVFDFLIIGISLLPTSAGLSVIRALRILRVLRLMSVVPQMRHVISALFHAIPGMASIVAVLMIIFYVSAVLATRLFGMHPDPNMQEWFGSVASSMYSLFQVMTLEGWSDGIVRPTMHVFPWAWMFFVPFIIVTSFAVLNLFIGIIVDAMQHAGEGYEQTETLTDVIHKDTAALRMEIGEIRRDLAALMLKLDKK
jgi:voltage-gated sodium channel